MDEVKSKAIMRGGVLGLRIPYGTVERAGYNLGRAGGTAIIASWKIGSRAAGMAVDFSRSRKQG